MVTGELDYDDNMYDKNDPTKPYYKLIYIIYILFAIGITLLVSNLLTSMKN
jgi:hypothetical protein